MDTDELIRWTCALCGAEVPGNRLGPHLRLSHPGTESGRYAFPAAVDGEPVIYEAFVSRNAITG
jgi:hypothetical protein